LGRFFIDGVLLDHAAEIYLKESGDEAAGSYNYFSTDCFRIGDLQWHRAEQLERAGIGTGLAETGGERPERG
jgi:hypothetical protein